MSAQRPRGSRTSSSSGDVPTLTATIAVSATVLMLMLFSVVSWRLGNATLAALAGTGACTLAAEAVRRYLGDATRRREAEQKVDDTTRSAE
ncbi:hypothetical protein AB0H28_08090 [Micromonospora sp. NPDC050980]|uniref:hypothetical protein n=1 Tax=Micromonospora sp. NPDC050980 TaxID=3155161 RepID=UPI0033E13C12